MSHSGAYRISQRKEELEILAQGLKPILILRFARPIRLRSRQAAEAPLFHGAEYIHVPLVSEADTDGAGGTHQFALRIDGFKVADGMGHVDGNDGVAVQCDHLAETSGGD
jgi:hypothetical protein